jgi:hypothetical protein
VPRMTAAAWGGTGVGGWAGRAAAEGSGATVLGLG